MNTLVKHEFMDKQVNVLTVIRENCLRKQCEYRWTLFIQFVLSMGSVKIYYIVKWLEMIEKVATLI